MWWIKIIENLSMQRAILISVLMFFTIVSYSQDLNTILKKHLEAHGQELWDQVKTVVIDGEWVTQEFQKYPMKLTFKSPNKIRIEGNWGGKRYAEVSNGKIAWAVAPWTGTSKPQLMAPLEHLIIENIYSLGSSLKPYANDVKLDGFLLYEGELLIKLSFENDYIKRDFYIDKDDYKLYWEVIESKVGSRLIIKKQYEKYRDYQGLLTPTSVRVFTKDSQKELIFENVSLGLGASNSLFEMP
ncbi:MAG: hypothetical protein ACJA08_001230 [Cyclobacteriaceae bacterium]